MNNTPFDAPLAKNNNRTTDANNTQQHIGVAHGGRMMRPEVVTNTDNTMLLLLKVSQQKHWVQHILFSLT